MIAYPVTIESYGNNIWLVDFENLNWQAKFWCDREALDTKIREEVKLITGDHNASVAIRIA